MASQMASGAWDGLMEAAHYTGGSVPQAWIPGTHIEVNCPKSASLIPNNLTSNGSLIAYAHKNDVIVITDSSSHILAGKSSFVNIITPETKVVVQIKWVRIAVNEAESRIRMALGESGLHTEWVLVILTIGGLIQIYDETGQNLYHFCRYDKDNQLNYKLSGIASDCNRRIFISTSHGKLIQLTTGVGPILCEIPKLLQEKLIPLNKGIIKGITALDSSSDYDSNILLALGFDNGSISVLNVSDDVPKRECFFDGQDGNPVTTILVYENWVIGGYLSGHIRFFNVVNKDVIEFAAHTRGINAIDFCRFHKLFVSSGQDSFIHILSLPENGKIKILHSQTIENYLICGVQFCAGSSGSICISGYDHHSLYVLPCKKVGY